MIKETLRLCYSQKKNNFIQNLDFIFLDCGLIAVIYDLSVFTISVYENTCSTNKNNEFKQFLEIFFTNHRKLVEKFEIKMKYKRNYLYKILYLAGLIQGVGLWA